MASESGYTSEQLQKLEEIFEEYCKFPNKKLVKKWSEDLGMDPSQIKNWFKNKVMLLKTAEKREENDSLRMENARLQLENNKMSKTLNCPTCTRNETLEDLLRENARLREKHQRATSMVGGILGSPELLQFQEQDTQQEVNLELSLAPTSWPTPINKN